MRHLVVLLCFYLPLMGWGQGVFEEENHSKESLPNYILRDFEKLDKHQRKYNKYLAPELRDELVLFHNAFQELWNQEPNRLYQLINESDEEPADQAALWEAVIEVKNSLEKFNSYTNDSVSTQLNKIDSIKKHIEEKLKNQHAYDKKTYINSEEKREIDNLNSKLQYWYTPTKHSSNKFLRSLYGYRKKSLPNVELVVEVYKVYDQKKQENLQIILDSLSDEKNALQVILGKTRDSLISGIDSLKDSIQHLNIKKVALKESSNIYLGTINLLKQKKTIHENSLIIANNRLIAAQKHTDILLHENDSLSLEISIAEVDKQKLDNLKATLLSEKEILEREKLKLETDSKELENNLNVLQKRVIPSIALIALLSTIIPISVFQKRNKKIKRDKEIVTDLYFRELAHRVKNNLTEINSLIRKCRKAQNSLSGTKALADLQNRVEAYSLIFRQLYKNQQINLNTVNLARYVDELMQYYRQSLDSEIEAILDIEKNIDLRVEKASNIGLIVNEIISNTFKHAIPKVDNPQLKIAAFRRNEEIQLKLSDNGPGFPNPVPPSFGLSLIRDLVRTEGGHLNRENRNGTTYTISIPYNPN